MSKEIETLAPVGQPRLVRLFRWAECKLARKRAAIAAQIAAACPTARQECERNALLEKYATPHAEAEKLTAENKRLRGAIERLEYERTKREPNKMDAPGHSHDVRSHWDMDGALCSWCDAWDQARAALQSLPNV
jgi:hypothetical protein